MRYIDPHLVASRLRPDWLRRSDEATAKVLAAVDADERDRVLKANQRVWGEIKPCLSAVSGNKCWYCESCESRSDNAVDHFRPKGQVAEDAGHDGYWWLAFKHGNYRYSCTMCNSYRIGVEDGDAGGKQDHFPLVDEASRARKPDDDVEDEAPLLIDPCSLYDVALLWFDERGSVAVNPVTSADDVNASARVESSARFYHLDSPVLVGARRRLYLEINDLCTGADRMREHVDMRLEAVKRDYLEKLTRLRRLTAPDAPLSAVASCALRGLRTRSATAQEFLSYYM